MPRAVLGRRAATSEGLFDFNSELIKTGQTENIAPPSHSPRFKHSGASCGIGKAYFHRRPAFQGPLGKFCLIFFFFFKFERERKGVGEREKEISK